MTAVARLVAGVRAGDVPSVARAMTLVENREPVAAEILHALWPATGRAWRVGITGPPGAGKSTLVASFRKAGKTVGVVAVDPTSPFTGGALLGDRVRMGVAHGDSGVFIRSM